MKWQISINQVGAYEYGFQGKTDLIDWAIIDYIQSWQSNPSAKRIGEMVWINYKQLIVEMPFLGLNDKSSVSRRVKKLSDLKLIDIFQDNDDFRLYAGITQLCFDAVTFKGVDSGKQGVDSESTFIRYQYPLSDTLSDKLNQEKGGIAKNAIPATSSPKAKRIFLSKSCREKIVNSLSNPINPVKAEKPKPLYETMELPEFIDRKLWIEWQAERKAKNKSSATQTERAFAGHVRDLSELEQQGYLANECLIILGDTGWLGVKPELCIDRITAKRNRNAQKSLGSATNTNRGLTSTTSNSGINYATSTSAKPAFRDFAQEEKNNAIAEARRRIIDRKANEAAIVLPAVDFVTLQHSAG